MTDNTEMYDAIKEVRNDVKRILSGECGMGKRHEGQIDALKIAIADHATEVQTVREWKSYGKAGIVALIGLIVLGIWNFTTVRLTAADAQRANVVAVDTSNTVHQEFVELKAAMKLNTAEKTGHAPKR